MKRISIIAVLTTIVPITSFAYDYTIFDADLRSRSYTVQEISQTVYNNALTSAESQGLNAPVFKTIENDEQKYYKWIVPDLIGYKTNTNANIFSLTNQGNGSIDSLNVANDGTVSTQHSYYTDLLRTYNRIENVSANTNINLWFIANPRSDIGDPVVGGAFSNSVADIIGIGGGFVGNSVRSNVSGVKAFGGAIYNNGQAIDLIDGVFIDNSASSVSNGSVGGAIYNTGNTINRINGVFIGNSTEGGSISSGGAIANQRVNNGFTEIGQILGVFISNHSSGDGAGIYNDLGTIGTITGDFVANSADYFGGAICNSTGEINAITGDFFGNSATSGGAIWSGVLSGVGNTSNIEMIKGVFVDNSATRFGGAILNTSFRSTIETIEANFINNSVKGSLYSEDTAGGAIYNNGIIGEINGDFSYNFVSGNANNKDFRAGAIYNYERIDAINGNFVGNYVVASSQGSYAQGGAIYNNVGSTIGSITGAFIDNSASSTYNGGWSAAFGGAIYNRGTIESIEADFRNNSVLSNGISGSMPVAQGGAIYNGEFATINSISGDFINNFIADGASTQEDGGAIYNKGTIGSLTGLFNGNSTQNHGGAIYNDTTAVIQNLSGDFFGNTAQNGGAIYNSGQITLNNSSFSDNHGYGGAIYNNGTLTLNHVDFSDNESYNNGGAIYNDNTGDIDTITGIFERNTALYGGAITNRGTIGVIDGVFTNNVATGDSGGGAIRNNETEIQTIIGDFRNNSAKYGGAIYNHHGTIDSINGNFESNSAVTGGAAIEVMNGSTINSISGNFTNNTAQYGGAIDVTGLNSIIGTISADFNGNIAGNSGGAIYNISGNTINSITGDFFANSSINGGGAIYNSGQITLVNNLLFSGNHSSQGGAINNSGNVNMNIDSNSRIRFDTASDDIHNRGIITANGTTDGTPGHLYLQTVLGTGTFTINNIDATLADGQTISQSEFNIGNNAVLHTSNTVTLTGNSTINGTLNLNITNIAANSTDYTGGKFIVGGNLTLGANSELSLTVANDLLQKGEQTGVLDFVHVDGNIVGDFGTLVANNLYDVIKSGDKYIIMMRNSVTDIITANGGTNNDSGAVDAWLNATFQTGSEQEGIQDNLNYLVQHDLFGMYDLLENIKPVEANVIGGNIRVIDNAINNQISDQLFKYRASKPSEDSDRVWATLLYSNVNQTSRYKYDANTFGIMLGGDINITKNFIVGMGYSYSNTSASSSAHSVDSVENTMSIYGEYNFENLYLNGNVFYSLGNHQDITRMNNNADFSSDTFGSAFNVGYKGFAQTHITPEIGIRYMVTNIESYRDKWGQEISYDNLGVLTLATRARYGNAMSLGEFGILLDGHVGLLYDVINKDVSADVKVADCSYKINSKSFDSFGIEFGIGVATKLSEKGRASLGYDLDWHDDFVNHTAKISAGYVF